MFYPTQKPSQFRISHKKQVNLDPHAKTELISNQTLEPSHFGPPHQNQVNSDPYTEIKSNWIPHNETMSISTTHTKTKSSSMLALKSSDFRPA